MKHTTALAAALLAGLPLARAHATSIFINELHYDNAGSDSDEAIEIAGPAGTDLAGWTLLLYNGGDGAVYESLALSGTIADQSGGYGTLYFAAPGTQNGPDGIALVDAAAVVLQFLSYEGTFTATDGAAAGMTSNDLGVFEDGTAPAGLTLQLTGSGNSYEDFAWSAGVAATWGAVNAGQSFSAAAPLPGALPLFAGALGWLGWRRRRH